MTEQEIIAGCKRQDRAAQSALYVLTADRIYRLLLRMTGRAEDAFDLSQEAFLKVFQSIDRFDGRSSVATWVYQIALNEGRQFLRSRGRERLRLQRWQEQDAGRNGGLGDADRLALRELVEQLPEPERTLVVLRHFEALSYDEISRLTEQPAGTVASVLYRARNWLRSRWTLPDRSDSRRTQPRAASKQEEDGARGATD